MKKILGSLLTIGLIASFAVFLTSSFFSDTETSKDNVLEAGSLDLKIDNESYYNGALNQNTTWSLDDLTNQLFFNFTDIKPDDYGEDTISLHAENDYWACMEIEVTKDDDVSCTEPEKADDPKCGVPGEEPNSDNFDGELGGVLNFVWWVDDGDNVFELGENILDEGNATKYINGKLLILADSSKNVFELAGSLLGTKTYYIGKAWCFGTLGKAPLPQANYDNPSGNNDQVNGAGTPEDGGFTCDGTFLNNATQTDSLLGDISFSAVQARHNPDFLCSGEEPSVTPTSTPTPTPLACNQADVMLVLDRSGSIDSTELEQLKTAAKDFVDALGLTTLGIHAGFTSFSTTGTLDQHLTDNGATVKTAIDSLASGGFTNLKDGLDLAKGEHANPGDGHDRADVSSPDKVIVITDGHPNRPLPSGTAPTVAKTSADAYRAAGAEIFVVGVGSDVDQSYLETIADNAAHYFPVTNYANLKTTLQNLDLCQ